LFWGRPSFYDLWHDLRAAASEIRPDWDLSTRGFARPGTRGYSKFHGWDRRASGRCRVTPAQVGSNAAACDTEWATYFRWLRSSGHFA
jgi:hypothetical protein